MNKNLALLIAASLILLSGCTSAIPSQEIKDSIAAEKAADSLSKVIKAGSSATTSR